MVKSKVVFILGATGTGKSKLSVNLATLFDGEIINSDKIQVYEGLDVLANKITPAEQRGVPHHLLGIVKDPDADFNQDDFCKHAMTAIERIIGRGRLPFVVGGSNSFVEALVEDPLVGFKSRYECCFIWLDVFPSVLNGFVSSRVDEMVRLGLVDEVREIYRDDADYTRGIRRAIGVPEMQHYLKAEIGIDGSSPDEEKRQHLLRAAIDKIKENTHDLTSRQVGKIRRMKNKLGLDIVRIVATPVFKKSGVEAEKEWKKSVLGPCIEIVREFIESDDI
ncbi:hypothetical protein MLD38_032310 [Melastoma candidum]|uniref:Uncharacterized protein n=1 Tax=Melastoma candidum TaxID=119954 RepID=A0ACB9M3W1_9MYRT|nr:hypothetical protein MLD38_032310 [Melastoma candidum]